MITQAAIILVGVGLIILAFYRDVMDQSFSSTYNQNVTDGLRWVGSVIVVVGAVGSMIEFFG